MDWLKEFEPYKEDFIKNLQKLLQIPSFSTGYNPENVEAPFGVEIRNALDFTQKLGKEMGFTTKDLDHYCGYIELGDPSLEMCGILCHLDVVPAVGQWRHDPFSAVIENGNIYARGALDDKGPTLAAIYALKMIKDAKIPLKRKVRIITGCDEELGMKCMLHYMEREPAPSIGFSPDADFPLIYGEKGNVSSFVNGIEKEDLIHSFYAGTRLNIVPDVCKVQLNKDLSKEFLSYLKENSIKGEYTDNTYIIYGEGAHAMHPQCGINAATLMCEFLKNYTQSNFVNYVVDCLSNDPFGKKLGVDCYDEEMKELTSNPALFKYEAGVFSIATNYRFPLDRNAKEILDQTTHYASKYHMEASISDVSGVHKVERDSFLVNSLYDAYVKYSKDTVNKPFTIGGGTYSRCFENNVAFGPAFIGDEDVVHQKNEYINLEKLYISIAIYAEAIVKLCA